MDAPWGVAPSSARYRDRQSIAGWPITWPMTGKELDMEHQQGWFVGIDWGSQDHQVHVSDAAGVRLGARSFPHDGAGLARSEEHTSELQSLMRISYAVFCLKKKKTY